jgi:septum formation protein
VSEVAPLLLASTSPQRRAILSQLGIPFEVEAPRYVEHDPPGLDPVSLVRRHAQGKARSLADSASERPLLAVDTAVVLDREVFGKPADAEAAGAMLARLSGRTHEVVSALCLLGPGWEELEHETTLVVFRPLGEREIAGYLASLEWRDRAGAYAIQGLGARLVERIDGDYLNVVGLPCPLLIRLLEERLPELL